MGPASAILVVAIVAAVAAGPSPRTRLFVCNNGFNCFNMRL